MAKTENWKKKKHAKDLSVSSLYICKKKKNLLKTIKKNYIILSSKAKFLLTSPSGSGPELILLTQKAFFLVWVLYTRITLKGRKNKNTLSVKLLKPHHQCMCCTTAHTLFKWRLDLQTDHKGSKNLFLYLSQLRVATYWPRGSQVTPCT